MNTHKSQPPRDSRVIVLLIVAITIVVVHNPWINAPTEKETEQPLVLDWQDNGFVIRKAGSDTFVGDVPPITAPFRFKKIPINQADSALLQTIPGIGPKRAEKIIDSRLREGPFADQDDLMRVDGIGPKRSQNLAHHIHFD